MKLLEWSRVKRQRAADTALYEADASFARELGVVHAWCRRCFNEPPYSDLRGTDQEGLCKLCHDPW